MFLERSKAKIHEFFLVKNDLREERITKKNGRIILLNTPNINLLKSKRARHFCRPFVLTNPLNSIAKLQIGATIKNYFLRC
jgi:hypothetical protein